MIKTKQKLSLTHNVLEAKNGDENPPLLVMLHGYGSHENDLFSFADSLNEKCTVVSVRAPIVLGYGGFAWYEIDVNNLGDKMSNIPQAKNSIEKIQNFIEEAHSAYGTNPKKTYLAGFSQGCILSYALALNYPEKFSKIVALSGYILKEIIPENFDTKKLQHLDFFVSHGTQDSVLPVEWARQSAQVLERLKISHQYREYPMPHGINPQCFEDMKNWMRERGMV